MAPRGRPKHVCNKCNKSFSSGKALGGHMSCHWRNAKQPKSTPGPTAIVVDLHVTLLSPSDKETSVPSSGTQCHLCPKVFSTCNSPREHMRKHSEKKVLGKPIEEAPGLMEALVIADGDNDVMLSPPVKRKRSKREMPVHTFGETDAAITLLLLSEHSSKISAYEDCYGEDKDRTILIPNVSKDVKLNSFDHLLVRSAGFKKPKGHKSSAYDDCYGQCEKDNNLIPNVPKKDTHLFASDLKCKPLVPTVPKNSAYEDCCGQCEKDNSLIINVPKKDSTLIPNVPEKDSTLIPNSPKDTCLTPNVPEKDNHSVANAPKEIELNVLDYGLTEDAELRSRGISAVEEMKCSSAVKVKRYQCNACQKSFGSGQSLGGHMRCHHPRRNDRQGLADCPDFVVTKEQKKKLELDSRLLDHRLPALAVRDYVFSGLNSEPKRVCLASTVH
ncbi:uncharacterized protein LOC100831297 [Brachypodium distachyon]|uniref:C2H2-type domain-containing protein n=1 Tax=Brachypodium distachyon TaxID=15368 RepID=A0A0Q3EIG7_BRADI|nr:uncharacterized protein LOC100831297 [Brachypodium distachyon]XP_014757680.1 uncharacterized protein LOC100831297 [Brachypodium distachyon]XP_014757681.1 uncharacterized protein LOC100831297 [Brachypodium distachyon]KQJ86148.1 hypothetical protein BRADI_4g03630v3 [Brachypodium distachyon]PNT62447.1 hypothetical protein BRADI_4g03630v3 [Brachypodium distachyon]PNT62448.1 hypothetical protein BRADI_4g03630v3 [Brachypodium distachyon]PNT62449.1 hypothetical protein BRADI_4g03630v3 [Brachypodi|eukprot:XP_003579251.1 uncharacterized protein LOC100831297 [Brachypodium distachyon]